MSEDCILSRGDCSLFHIPNSLPYQIYHMLHIAFGRQFGGYLQYRKIKVELQVCADFMYQVFVLFLFKQCLQNRIFPAAEEFSQNSIA